MGKDDKMAEYLCDSCKHAKPAKREYQTSNGYSWEYGPGRYVRCPKRKNWVVEKTSECNDYDKAGA